MDEISTRNKKDILGILLEEAVQNDDSTLLNFMLRKCWNKSQVFQRRNEDGNSFLHETCRKNYSKCTRVLIENGADVNTRNNEGNTGLHLAVFNSNMMIVCLLIEAGVDPFIENKEGIGAFDIVTCTTIKEKLRQYSIKCSEIKLIQNLAAWKRIVDEEDKREALIKEKQEEFQRNRTISYQSICSTTDTDNLKRSDSGIVSDAESDKSVDQLIATMPAYTQMFAHHSKRHSEKAKGSRAGVKELSSLYSHGVRRVVSSEPKYEGRHCSQVGAIGLKVSSLYANIKRTPTVRRRRYKVDRAQRMSMPELPTFGSPESYI